MKFGSVPNPEEIDFTLPPDHEGTSKVLSKESNLNDIYVGCAKWNRQDLKGFYPRGTKDELRYYASQFNSIELNATFYNTFSTEQVSTWRTKTPDNFKFFPKVHQYISHVKRLNDVGSAITEYCDSVAAFEEKLGMAFLQLHNNFAPKNFQRLVDFLQLWPSGIPLAIELRHSDWYNDEVIANDLYQLFEEKNIANIITDTAGRRDLLHMRLTTKKAFIRYVGANHESDYQRLDDWVVRLKEWKENGLESLYFFVHQNLEKESPLLSSYFIKQLNKNLGCNLTIPQVGNKPTQADLFS